MKEIKLLEDQIKKLDDKGFNLSAWKQYTVVLLARIFGENDPKIPQIEKIEYNHSSWSLRDSAGKAAYLDTCKKLGREVLQAAIDELNTFGLPGHDQFDDKSIDTQVIMSALEDELKVSQIRKIMEIVNGSDDREQKKNNLREVLKDLDQDFPVSFIVVFLSSAELKGKLKKI